jgi:hypothetical protein
MGLDQEPVRVVGPYWIVQPPAPGMVLPHGTNIRFLERHAREPRLQANHELPLQRAAKAELADAVFEAIAFTDAEQLDS